MLPSVDELKLVSCTEVCDIIAAMTNNKAGDCYGLWAEHFKLAGDLYYSLLATCFNVMLIHGFIPAEATQTVICPTIKDKNGISSDASNYRPIALTTIFSKIFEHVLSNRVQEYLFTTDNQFGCKRGNSTLMPILLLKELLRFYQDLVVPCLYVFYRATLC